jgi:cold shock CspA family protein
MHIQKYLATRMYGFVQDISGKVAFFHLGSFCPLPNEVEPIPPIPGELVEVEVDFSIVDSKGRVPRAEKVSRTSLPVLLSGFVDMFDMAAGYGFIRCGGDLYFLHRSEICENKVPLVGNAVQFYAGVRDEKSRACYVKVL